jgi:hypothetical protein
MPNSLRDDQYRFSGYDFNLLTLDETGPTYIVVQQNEFTVKPTFEFWGATGISLGGTIVDLSGAPPNLLDGSHP